MAADICLPVLKLSHATNAHANESVSWTHLSSSSLFLTIKGDSAANTKLHMCIVERNNVLESVHLGGYIDRAIEARRRSRESGFHLQPEQLPIFGMTKDVLFALRYITSQSQVRRLQLRMQTIDHCKVVLQLLKQRGLEVQYQRPNTARPGTSDSQNRPLTVQADLPCSSTVPSNRRPAAFHLPSVEPGSFSQLQRPEPDRLHSPKRMVHASPRHILLDPSQLPVTVDNCIPPSESQLTRPATAASYQSTGAQASDTSQAVHVATASGEFPTFPAKKSLSTGVSGSMSDRFMVDSRVGSSLAESLDNSVSGSKRENGAELPMRPTLSAAPLPPVTLEHEIPPRRELPFKRPESRRSGTDQVGSRPSSALELPPLPKPKTKDIRSDLVHESESRLPAKNDVFTYPCSSPPSKSVPNSSLDDSSSTVGRTRTTKAFGSSISSPMKQLSARKQPLGNQTSTSQALRLNSLLDAPHEIVSPPGTSHVSPKPPVQNNKSTETIDFTTSPLAAVAAGTAGAEGHCLSMYAAQSHEDRAAALDEFMASKLEDPSFTVLCRDVENCWRRIALGL